LARLITAAREDREAGRLTCDDCHPPEQVFLKIQPPVARIGIDGNPDFHGPAHLTPQIADLLNVDLHRNLIQQNIIWCIEEHKYRLNNIAIVALYFLYRCDVIA
jgi:hypothetical protein